MRLGEAASGRDNNFNLLRMLAATGVLVSHAYPIALGPGAPEPLERLLRGTNLGDLCVYAFFAISGFFIAQSWDRAPDPARFLQARALRLFPALAAVLLVTVAVGLWLTTVPAALFWPDAAHYVIRNLSLFFLQYPIVGVFEDNPYGPAINGSLWTLNYEVLCYLGVLVGGMLGLIRRPAAMAGVFALALAAHAAGQALALPYRMERLIELGLPFAAGATLYAWRDRIPLGAGGPFALSVLAAALYATPAFQATLVLALCAWVMWLGFAPGGAIRRYNALGDYSYGMYVYAFPAQQLMAWAGIDAPLANAAAALPLTLACAVLSWRLVEKPALRLKDRRPAVVA